MTQAKLEWKMNGVDMFRAFDSNSDMLSFAQHLLNTCGDLDVVVKQWLTVNINGVRAQGDKLSHDFCKLSDLV